VNKVTIQTLVAKKADHRKITMLAVYDYPFAKLAEAGNIDSILVGDSIGMTVFGYPQRGAERLSESGSDTEHAHP
jgi:ketopantoate hydroxymethyltransferase